MINLVDGEPGACKSVWMNMKIHEQWRKGCDIDINWPVKYGPEGVEQWHDFGEVLESSGKTGKPKIIGCDEAAKIFDAYRWASFPPAQREKLAEHRHDLVVLWTATQSFFDVNTQLRSKVSVWWHCVSIFRFPADETKHPWIQLSWIYERVRRFTGDRSVWITRKKHWLFISKFWTKILFNTYENLKLSKFVCQLRSHKNKPIFLIASREAVNSGKARF